MLNYWRNQAHLESNAHIRSILVCCPINSKKINIRFRKKPSGALVCQPWMQLSCCSTFVIFFSQFGFFHLSLSGKTNYFVDSVPLKIFIWKHFDGISGTDLHDSLHDVAGKTEGGHLCVCVRARACMPHNGCDVSTALINSEPTEHGDHGDVPERIRLHSDDSSSPRRFGRLTCKSNTCKPASFGWPNSKRSSVRVDKFTAGAPCLERESREKKRDETRRVPPLWLIHPGVNIHLRRGNTAQP